MCIRGRENVGIDHFPIEVLMPVTMGNMCSDYIQMATYIYIYKI
jgi:hypothetical protein